MKTALRKKRLYSNDLNGKSQNEAEKRNNLNQKYAVKESC